VGVTPVSLSSRYIMSARGDEVVMARTPIKSAPFLPAQASLVSSSYQYLLFSEKVHQELREDEAPYSALFRAQLSDSRSDMQCQARLIHVCGEKKQRGVSRLWVAASGPRE